nr:MAG TPA: hypothetical protein [Caudoviricetes sp.]
MLHPLLVTVVCYLMYLLLPLVHSSHRRNYV